MTTLDGTLLAPRRCQLEVGNGPAVVVDRIPGGGRFGRPAAGDGGASVATSVLANGVASPAGAGRSSGRVIGQAGCTPDRQTHRGDLATHRENARLRQPLGHDDGGAAYGALPGAPWHRLGPGRHQAAVWTQRHR